MKVPPGRIGVVMVSFGEPLEPTLANVTAYLERIFLQNASLDGHVGRQALERARRLAETRAPALVSEYVDIGGSPLNAQADRQAVAVAAELLSAGWDVIVYSAFQFTSPTIRQRLEEARTDGVSLLVSVPVYPLCGRSTSVAAVHQIRQTVSEMGWPVQTVSVTGWHHHVDYVEMWAHHILEFASDRNLSLNSRHALLYFSAHGTPVKYLQEGSRYDRYVAEHCSAVSAAAGVDRYEIGFQNHSGRGIPWTQPDNQDLIKRVDTRQVLVAPISFMHEQSETLSELDGEFRRLVEASGKEFHRVPVPFDHPRFTSYLAGLIARLVTPSIDSGLSPCRCSGVPDVWCTNGDRDLPPSTFIPDLP